MVGLPSSCAVDLFTKHKLNQFHFFLRLVRIVSSVKHQLPREKLIQHGVEKLTTPELIALLLGNGIANLPVEQLAEKVSEELRNTQVNLTSLLKIRGIGIAKACQLLAMIEFVERLRPRGFPVIDQLSSVLGLVSELKTAQREHIVCLYLNTRLQLLLKETVAIGSVNQSVITARDVFSVIKYHPVSYIILVHNHPSGNPRPSPEDLQFTHTMVAAGKILGVEVLDHVIVGEAGHYSLKEHRQL